MISRSSICAFLAGSRAWSLTARVLGICIELSPSKRLFFLFFFDRMSSNISSTTGVIEKVGSLARICSLRTFLYIFNFDFWGGCHVNKHYEFEERIKMLNRLLEVFMGNSETPWSVVMYVVLYWTINEGIPAGVGEVFGICISNFQLIRSELGTGW
jgi:hypothetical protein